MKEILKSCPKCMKSFPYEANASKGMIIQTHECGYKRIAIESGDISAF